MKTEVLIVGAGPTGLALALWLTRLGVAVRIIDQNAEAAPYSRALGVQARTLEFYRQLGFAQRAVDAGVEVVAINLWAGGKRRAHVPIGAVGEGLTPYPYLLDFAQDRHERLLIDELHELGVSVERSTALVTFTHDEHAARASLKRDDGTVETVEARYLAGCDGAHSTVRERLKIGLPGGTYTHLFYVADIVGSGPAVNGELHVDLEETDLLAVFAMKGEGHVRLVGTIETHDVREDEKLTFDDVSQDVIRRMRFTIDKVNWFSTYRVHHRVAERFNDGRVFLLGGAAHIHSPVGGQGMNTGIGDAVNLAWKLADVLSGRGANARLESYGVERMAFARRLVKTTDRAFVFATNTQPVMQFERKRVLPVVANLLKIRALRRLAFRTVSQINIHYRMSALSRGRAGRLCGGDRLPWVERASAGGDNLVPLQSLKWQIHVYGEVPKDVERACSDLDLPLHSFAWQDVMKRAGIARGALYLVRPDGYIALAAKENAAASLRAYAAAFLTRPDRLGP